MPCQLQRTSGYYGGEKYYEEVKDTSAQECQKACLFNKDCETVSYTESRTMRRCLLYREGQFRLTEDRNSVYWDKKCEGGFSILCMLGNFTCLCSMLILMIPF